MASVLTIKPSDDPAMLAVEEDISEPATADRIITKALARFGRVDTLVNNASVLVSKPFTDNTAEDYALVVGLNLTGFSWLTPCAVAEMLIPLVPSDHDDRPARRMPPEGNTPERADLSATGDTCTRQPSGADSVIYHLIDPQGGSRCVIGKVFCGNAVSHRSARRPSV